MQSSECGLMFILGFCFIWLLIFMLYSHIFSDFFLAWSNVCWCHAASDFDECEMCVLERKREWEKKAWFFFRIMSHIIHSFIRHCLSDWAPAVNMNTLLSTRVFIVVFTNASNHMAHLMSIERYVCIFSRFFATARPRLDRNNSGEKPNTRIYYLHFNDYVLLPMTHTYFVCLAFVTAFFPANSPPLALRTSDKDHFDNARK